MGMGSFGVDADKYDIYDDYLFAVSSRYRSNAYGLFVTPDTVADIFSILASHFKPQNILVPYFSMGKITNTLLKNGYCVDSIIRYEKEREIASKFGFNEFQAAAKKYKLICAEPPFDKRQIDDMMGQMDMFSEILEEGGLCAYIFPISVKFDGRYLKLLEHSKNIGLRVDAVIDLPKGTYYPYAGIDTKLILFSKKANTEHFIATIAERKDIEIVIANYINGITAKKYSIGSWVEDKQFFDIQDFERELNLSKAVKRFNGERVPLSKLAKDIKRPSKENTFEDLPDSIYISALGTSDVVDSLEDLKIKPQNYYQVVIDTEMASTEYVCYFLNNIQGVRNRKDSMMGTIITRFNLQTLSKLEIIVPSISEQNKILDTQRQIQELKAQIDALGEAFEKNPSSYVEVQKNIKEINNYHTITEWGEGLPFPLASILRRYFAETAFEKKLEALFQFFEAYSIYNACILLSIINESMDVIDLEAVFSGTDSSYYTRSSFGNWVILNKVITNYVLGQIKLIEKDENDNSLLGLFKTNNLDLIKLLCNKNINTILYSVSKRRNEWKGHGGVAGQQILEARVIELERKLSDMRTIIKNTFDEVELVRSTGMHFKDGQFESNIEQLRGSNAMFMKDSFSSTTPLDETKLYVIMKDSGIAIPLLPLIIFKKSPDNVKNACYFFSRETKDDTLYISYHYDSEPEEIEPGHEVVEAITKILPEKASE